MARTAAALVVTVMPERFTMVDFDAERVAALVADMAGQVGLPALGVKAVTVEVDETVPLGQARLIGLEPVHLHVESGGFEDPKRLRQLSEPKVRVLSGLLLFQARDRLDPSFGAPPMDQALTLAHQVAWDAYAVGRLERLGHVVQRQRRLYHFRNRHGFTDAADEAFHRLWTAPELTWPQVVSISDGANGGAQPG